MRENGNQPSAGPGRDVSRERRQAAAVEAVYRAGRRRDAARAAVTLAEADLRCAVRGARAEDTKVSVRRVADVGGISPTTVTAWTGPGAAEDVDGRADRLDAEALLEDGCTLRVVFDPGSGGVVDEDGDVIDPPGPPGIRVSVIGPDGAELVAEGAADTLLDALLNLHRPGDPLVIPPGIEFADEPPF